MSVSRDFIDSYSPEVPVRTRDGPAPLEGPAGIFKRSADHGVTKLAFRFQTLEDLFKPAVSLDQPTHFVLALAQKGFQRFMQSDRRVDLHARSRAVGAE